MNKIGLKFGDSDSENEYRQRRVSMRYPLALTLGTFIFIYQIIWISVIGYQVYFVWISCVAIDIILAIMLFFHKKIGNILNFTLIFFSSYLFFQVYYTRETNVSSACIFDSTFLLGYNMALLNRLLHGAMIRFKFVILAELIYSIPKIILTRDLPYDIVLFHAMFVASSILIMYLDERKDRDIFSQYLDGRNSLLKFKKLFESYLPEGIIVIEERTKNILFQNDVIESLFVLEPIINTTDVLEKIMITKVVNVGSELINQRLSLFLLEISYNQTYTAYCEYPSSTEEKIKLRVIIFPFIWDDKPTRILLFSDLSNEEAILRLKILDEQKDRAISVISHELRNPISGIIGILESIKKNFKENRLLSLIDICRANADYLLNLLNSILDLQQIRAGRIKLYNEYIDIKSLILEIFKMFDFPISQKNLELKLEFSPQVKKWILTDKNRFSQVIINLISNALKFTLNGSITVKVNADEQDRSKIWFHVKDTGVGIKPEDTQRLFQAFGRLEDTESLNIHGVGLGLIISNNIIKEMNDEKRGIFLESKYGEGSDFYFYLTTNLDELQKYERESESYLYEEDEEKIANQIPFFKTTLLKDAPKSLDQDSILEPNKQIGETVLLVEDNPFNQFVVKNMIEDKGMKCLTASHGLEAIEKVLDNNNKIKLILMDSEMPIMDGFEATKRLIEKMNSKEIASIPIYALTANNLQTNIDKGKLLGMEGHLVKPLKEFDLEKIAIKHGLIHIT